MPGCFVPLKWRWSEQSLPEPNQSPPFLIPLTSGKLALRSLNLADPGSRDLPGDFTPDWHAGMLTGLLACPLVVLWAIPNQLPPVFFVALTAAGMIAGTSPHR